MLPGHDVPLVRGPAVLDPREAVWLETIRALWRQAQNQIVAGLREILG